MDASPLTAHITRGKCARVKRLVLWAWLHSQSELSMLFNSIPYLIFFPLVLAVVWLSPKSWRPFLLLVASYIFYMSWIPVYGLLIAALTAINYVLALAMGHWRRHAKALLLCGVVANLGALCYYKYTEFFLSNIQDASKWVAQFTHQSGTISPIVANVILPLGISFFAFEFIHYLVDVYRGGTPVKGPVNFALFAAFFPSQLAGPIKRYQDFIAQLLQQKPFTLAQFNDGFGLFLQGLFKKVALADNLGVLVNSGFAQTSNLGTTDAWTCVVGFTIQVYFDFSGYTDMGRGSAKMLGFELPDNFNFPYLATSLRDIWKRWHISLSSWLRDYLYIPLGGNGDRNFIKFRNLFLTMLLGGLWHGAAWHFVVWGALHGLGLIVNHSYDDIARKSPSLMRFHATSLGIVLSTVLTMSFFAFAIIFFRSDDVPAALSVIKTMLVYSPATVLAEGWQSSTVLVALTVYGLYSAVFSLPNYTKGSDLIDKLGRLRQLYSARINAPWQIAWYCGIALTIVGFSPAVPSPFIYFQF